MTRQTVGMYAGAKREQCDRSESGLETIGLERDAARLTGDAPRSLSVDVRLVGRMGLNYESKTATRSSEDKNRQIE